MILSKAYGKYCFILKCLKNKNSYLCRNSINCQATINTNSKKTTRNKKNNEQTVSQNSNNNTDTDISMLTEKYCNNYEGCEKIPILPLQFVLNNLEKDLFDRTCEKENNSSLSYDAKKAIKNDIFYMPKNKVLFQSLPVVNKNGNKSLVIDNKCRETEKLATDLTNSYKESLTNKNKKCEEETFYRESALKIQMVSKPLFEKIFKTQDNINDLTKDNNRINDSINILKENGLWNSHVDKIKDVDFILPSLYGKNLNDHFLTIGESYCLPYKNLLFKLVSSIPNMPLQWKLQPGWIRYYADGSYKNVACPDCKALVFDTEVCLSEGSFPTMAVAVSDKYWYSWCSKSLTDFLTPIESDYNFLVPFEYDYTKLNIDNPRIIVGHNVSYDRVRLKEQYFIDQSKLRFLDTMSMHIAVSGFINEQKLLIEKFKKSNKKTVLQWMFLGSKNSLEEVHKFYCKNKEPLKKEIRNIFISGTIQDIHNNFESAMTYCAYDVKATFEVLQHLLPLFFERFPHPVTFFGMLEMGSTYLPINDNWIKYIEASDKAYRGIDNQLNEELVKQAQICLKYKEEEKYKEDLWLWNLDWKIPKGRVKKLPFLPQWYRKLCQSTGSEEGTPEPEGMSTSLQIVPKLLKLTWNGYPLHYDKLYGWGYLVPLSNSFIDFKNNIIDAENESNFPLFAFYKYCEEKKLFCYSYECNNKTSEKMSISGKEIGIPTVLFFSLPHKLGPNNRVGNPLAKDFLNKIEDGTLSSHLHNIADILRTTRKLSYWKNNRDRILSQKVIWLDESTLSESVKLSVEFNSKRKYGSILPQVISAGTITRRAVEKTWMTASNAYSDRIGSELKAMIQAPPGYCFVGADVDSEELWIASLLGDAYFSGYHGSTPFGYMTLKGNKKDKNDMHSCTAEVVGISRDNAKVINYGRIYGAGLKFTERLLKQFNPRLSDTESRRNASDLFKKTKGSKSWYLSNVGLAVAKEVDHSYSGRPLTKQQIKSLIHHAESNGYSYTFDDLVSGPQVWSGGSESYMFNCLEEIASSEHPKTPVLSASITRTLEPEAVSDQFMTSRVNWVVQSSAVDYLHILLLCMRWLFDEYDIDGRFSISIHDEVRYLVKMEDCYRAALALQISNLLTRSFFSVRLGINDLPQSVAFFTSVDIDRVLRKEPLNDCITPSNPLGLEKTYNIPKGKSLNIYEIVDITGGCLDRQ